MKIEIDLDNLGFHYDEDGDPVGKQTIEDAVICAAASRVISDRDIKEKVSRVVDEVVRANVQAVVASLMDEPIQRRTPWGETVGEPTTVREIVRQEIEKFFEGKQSRRDPYGRESAANLKELITDVTRDVLGRDLTAEVQKARTTVKDAVTGKALAAAIEVLQK